MATVEDLWDLCGRAFGDLALEHAILRTPEAEGQAPTDLPWSRDGSRREWQTELAAKHWAARLPLEAGEIAMGELLVTYRVGEDSVALPEIPELLDELCRRLTKHLYRVSRLSTRPEAEQAAG